MPTIQIDHCRRTFHQELLTTNSFLRLMRYFRVDSGRGSYRPIGIRTIELLAGLQLLKMHLAWEGFVESVFVRYMCGCTSPSGFAPVLLQRRAQSTAAAMATLLGNKRYLQWTPSETVARTQTFFQNGEPFNTAINSAIYELESICTIRNRFAHRSEHAAIQFRNLIRNELGYNPPGMTPGRFLLSRIGRGSTHQPTFFAYYTNVLRVVSHIIVP